MKIGIPQLIMLFILIIGLIDTIIEDSRRIIGMKRSLAALIDTAIVIGLLYWGGFFS